ncbi:hypothetical protein [Nostoc sp.]|uniref:hypothetical protein n=1 Tax=Nostoc sp. TaxID=1180 RepID=UPI002FF46844
MARNRMPVAYGGKPAYSAGFTATQWLPNLHSLRFLALTQADCPMSNWRTNSVPPGSKYSISLDS